MKLYTLLLLLSVNCAQNIQADGLIVLINGTSCVGKSTLTQELANALKAYYHVHECTAQECCSMSLSEYAGKAWYILHTDDILDYICEQEGDKAEGCWIQVLKKVAEYACYLARNDKYVIVDTQLISSLPFALFDYPHIYTILVYAPLSVLCLRDQCRAHLTNRSYQYATQCRYYILEAFMALYRPARDGEIILDHVNYMDLVNAVLIPGHNIQHVANDTLSRLFEEMKSLFNLDSVDITSIPITSSIKYDLVVSTHEESAAMVAQRIMISLPSF